MSLWGILVKQWWAHTGYFYRQCRQQAGRRQGMMMEGIWPCFLVSSGPFKTLFLTTLNIWCTTQIPPLRREIRGSQRTKNSDSVAVGPHFFAGREKTSALPGLSGKGGDWLMFQESGMTGPRFCMDLSAPSLSLCFFVLTSASGWLSPQVAEMAPAAPGSHPAWKILKLSPQWFQPHPGTHSPWLTRAIAPPWTNVCGLRTGGPWLSRPGSLAHLRARRGESGSSSFCRTGPQKLSGQNQELSSPSGQAAQAQWQNWGCLLTVPDCPPLPQPPAPAPPTQPPQHCLGSWFSPIENTWWLR